MSGISLLDLFTLAGGLALFLYGMQQGERNLKRIGSAPLRKIIGAVTRHRVFGYTAGLFLTLITQSSSATTVILIGRTDHDPRAVARDDPRVGPRHNLYRAAVRL